ncbi:zinc finger, CCHC-type containing protein [Tanacetum coccineum]
MVVAAMSVVYVFTTPILEDELWDSLEAKYMAEDASSKKFLVSNFTNYKITDSRPVMEQHNELLGRFTQRKMNMDEAIQISCIIDKLYRSWKLLLSWAVICALRSPSGRRIVTSQRETMLLVHSNWTWTESRVLGEAMAVVRLPDPKLKTLSERGIECIFVGYAEHSKAFRLYAIEPNDSVSINSIIKSRDAIFDENRFSLVPRPSLRIPNGIEDNGGSVVPKEVTEEVVQQPKPELRKSKRNRTSKDFGPEFQLYLIEGTRDEMDVKIAFLNGDLDEEQAPKQWHQKFNEVVLSNGYLLNQADKCVYSKFDETGKGVIICLYVDDMLIFGTDQVQVDLTKEFLLSRFFMKDIGKVDVIPGIRIKHESNGIAISQSHYIEKVLKKFNYFDCTPISTPMDTSEKLIPNNGQAVSQLVYSRVIGCLMPGTIVIKETMDYRLTYTGYALVLEGYTDAS